MRLLRLLRPYLWFLTMLRLLGLLPWYLGFLQLPSLPLSVLFALRKRTSLSGRIQVVPLEDDQAVLSAAAPDLDDDKVTTQAAVALGAEVAVAFPLDDEVVFSLGGVFSRSFLWVTLNLPALSQAVNVSHEFLAGYDIEHGLGQPVSEFQAAAVLEGDQLVTQAVAAREEEASHFQKFGPLLQEKIQFFVKGDGVTRVCHVQPSEPLSSVLELSSCSYACHNGKCLDVVLSTIAAKIITCSPFCSGQLISDYSYSRGGGAELFFQL